MMFRILADRRVLVLTLLVAVMGTAACTSHASKRTGTIVGSAPLCYGPGPAMNLHPITTIRAVRADGVSHTVRVHTSSGHNSYRMTLPPGTYTVSTYSVGVAAVVRANAVTSGVNLPQPGCL